MNDFNDVSVIGNLTREPVMSKNNVFVHFGVALNRSYKDKEGNLVESVSFVNCKASGKIAENIFKYCKKGKKVWLNGCLEQERWEKDGVKHENLLVFVKNYRLIASKKSLEVSQVNEENYNDDFEESNI